MGVGYLSSLQVFALDDAASKVRLVAHHVAELRP